MNNETRRFERVTRRANSFCLVKATRTDGKGGIATGYKSEKAASFPDYIEKAESGSIGRALAALGYVHNLQASFAKSIGLSIVL